MATTGWQPAKLAEIAKTAREIKAQHGFLVGGGYWCFRVFRKATGWNLCNHILNCYDLYHPDSHHYDNQTKKFTPRAQDKIVVAGVVVTAICCVTIARGHRWVGIIPLIAHLWGMAVYHLNVIAFDELSKHGDPRPWSYRRIFFQVVINFLETLFIFAGFYLAARQCLSFGEALFWSVQGLTLNVPYQWQNAPSSVHTMETSIFTVQVFITLFFLVVVFSLIASAMFKRPDIAEYRQK